MHLKECAPIPVEAMWAQAVVISGKVYVGGGIAPSKADGEAGSFLVHEYDLKKDEWSTLPPAPVKQFGVGQLNGKLVLVGGVKAGAVTADIHVFEEEETEQWTKSIPAMPSARSAAAVISHKSALAVCGGTSSDGNPCSTVLVYNSASSQWHSGPSLPFRRTLCTGMVIDDTCYIAAGCDLVLKEDTNMADCFNSAFARRSVVSAPFPIILDPQASASQPWKSMADTPYYNSSITATGNCLIALGGHKEVPTGGKMMDDDVVTAAYAHPLIVNSWYEVGELPTPRILATAVPLLSGELFVTAGGSQDERKPSFMAHKEEIDFEWYRDLL